MCRGGSLWRSFKAKSNKKYLDPKRADWVSLFNQKWKHMVRWILSNPQETFVFLIIHFKVLQLVYPQRFHQIINSPLSEVNISGAACETNSHHLLIRARNLWSRNVGHKDKSVDERGSSQRVSAKGQRVWNCVSSDLFGFYQELINWVK